MTAKELTAMLGKQMHLLVKPWLRILVTVEDGRTSYGEIQYQVAPVSGQGTVWVAASSLEY
jgi:hypothetical protein